MNDLDRVIKSLDKAKRMQPEEKLLNKLDSIQSESSAVAGEIHSICNEFREILYGYDQIELHRLEALLNRLEVAEKISSHLWGLTNFVYVNQLIDHEKKWRGGD